MTLGCVCGAEAGGATAAEGLVLSTRRSGRASRARAFAPNSLAGSLIPGRPPAPAARALLARRRFWKVCEPQVCGGSRERTELDGATCLARAATPESDE